MLCAVQLQQDQVWAQWVELAFSKLDSNGDGFIDLDELIAKLPLEAESDAATQNERMLEVRYLPLKMGTSRITTVCQCYS